MTINNGYFEGCPLCYVVHEVTCKEDDSFSGHSGFDVDYLVICSLNFITDSTKVQSIQI